MVDLGKINLETYEKTIREGAFGLTNGLILILTLVSGVTAATNNRETVILSGIAGVIIISFINPIRLVVNGFTARQQPHKKNLGKHLDWEGRGVDSN